MRHDTTRHDTARRRAEREAGRQFVDGEAHQRTNAPIPGGEETDPSPPQETHLNRHDHTVTNQNEAGGSCSDPRPDPDCRLGRPGPHVEVSARIQRRVRRQENQFLTGITMHCGAVLVHTLMVHSREQTASARIRRLSNGQGTQVLACLRNAMLHTSCKHKSDSMPEKGMKSMRSDWKAPINQKGKHRRVLTMKFIFHQTTVSVRFEGVLKCRLSHLQDHEEEESGNVDGLLHENEIRSEE